MPTYKVYVFSLDKMKEKFNYGIDINSQTFHKMRHKYIISMKKNSKKWDNEFPNSSDITTRIWFSDYVDDVLCNIDNDVICYEKRKNVFYFYVKQK